MGEMYGKGLDQPPDKTGMFAVGQGKPGFHSSETVPLEKCLIQLNVTRALARPIPVRQFPWRSVSPAMRQFPWRSASYPKPDPVTYPFRSCKESEFV